MNTTSTTRCETCGHPRDSYWHKRHSGKPTVTEQECEQDGCKAPATYEYHYRELVNEVDEWHRYCGNHLPLERSSWIIETRALPLLPKLESAPPEDATDVAADRIRQLLLTGDLNAIRADLVHVADFLEQAGDWIGGRPLPYSVSGVGLRSLLTSLQPRRPFTDYLHDIYEEQKAQRKAMERIADALEQIAEGQ